MVVFAVLFFFTAAARGQTGLDAQALNKMDIVKLALQCKTGEAGLGSMHPGPIQEKALAVIERAFHNIALAGLSEEDINRLGSYLPEQLNKELGMICALAQTDMPVQDKVAMLVDSSGASCDEIIYTAIIVEVLSWFGLVPYLGVVGDLLFAVAILCYLGIM